MLLNSWLKSFRTLCESTVKGQRSVVGRRRRNPARRKNAKSSERDPAEVLEQRSLLTTFNPTTAAELISNINTANSNAEADVIDLGGLTFSLTTVDNGGTSPNGLPRIGSDGGNPLTIRNGTVERATGSPRFRIFDVRANANVTFDSVTITGANPANSGVGFNKAGGAIRNAGDVRIINSTLSENSVHSFGAGLANRGIATIVNSTIGGNKTNVTGSGAGIWNEGGTVNLENTIVAGNFTSSREDIYNFGGVVNSKNSLVGIQSGSGVSNGVDGNITGVDWTVVLENDGTVPVLTDNGGATQTIGLIPGSPAINAGDDSLAIDENGNTLTTDQRGESRFVGTVDIGAFEYREADSLVVTTELDVIDPTDDLTSLREAVAFANSNPNASVITFGDGSSLSGGTDFTDATADTITLGGSQVSIITSATVDGPGADLLTVSGDNVSRVFNIGSNSNVTLDSLTIANGREADGAAIRIGTLSTVTLANSTVANNVSTNRGGIFVNGTLTAINSTVTQNSAKFGGGFHTRRGNITLINSTVANNTATDGGGVYVAQSNGNLTMTSSTVAGNSATNAGGGIFSAAAISMDNTIVAANTATTDAEIAASANGNNNLIGDGTSAGGLNAANGNIIGIDWTTVLENDGLAPTLADNGGATATIALLPGSAAINVGDDAAAAGLNFDQRGAGFDRFAGTVDIGAFEVQNLPPTADPGGSYGVSEGSVVTLDGSGSSDADNAIVDYEWDFNYDGVTFDVDETGVAPAYTGSTTARLPLLCGCEILSEQNLISSRQRLRSATQILPSVA